MKTCKTNKELLLLIQKDDKVAFYNLYERYAKRVYGFVFRYIKQDIDTEGIVQDIFIKIWEYRNKIDVCISFEPFLFTITYNASISLLRKKLNEKKYLEHLKTLQRFDHSPDLMDEIEFNELNEKVESLLNKLTSRQKEIFRLSRLEGLSHDEIAGKLGISINTVKKHMTNSLVFLKCNIDTSLITR